MTRVITWDDFLAESITKNPLFLYEYKISDSQIMEGVLKDESGKEYKIHDGLADFIPKKEYLIKNSPLFEPCSKDYQNYQKTNSFRKIFRS